jgi:hypothetical protein
MKYNVTIAETILIMAFKEIKEQSGLCNDNAITLVFRLDFLITWNSSDSPEGYLKDLMELKNI